MLCTYVWRSENNTWESGIELRLLGLGTGLYSLNPGPGLGTSILMLLFVARIRDGIICSPRGTLPAALENFRGFPEFVKSRPPWLP